MAYNAAELEKYHELVQRGQPFRSVTCPYCNGSRDATVKHIDPKRKPQSPWDFWDNIVCAPSTPHAAAPPHEMQQEQLSDQQRRRRPMYVVGPMVDQSELPFRLLCRRYGATLAYTPMLHARSFAQSASYRQRHFSTTPDADGKAAGRRVAEEVDHPLFVQFCGNDADTLLAAARHVEEFCEAVDLNLGCPQGIARRGHYGSFLMEDWELVHCILHCLAVELRVPVTAKMRLFDDDALTLKYAEMLRDTGIAVLCVHGRTRCMKGQQTGLADLDMIRRVREHLGGSIPVIANGNVLAFDDVQRNLKETACEGYMCAEPLLWDPRLFAAPGRPVRSGRHFAACRAARLDAIAVAEEYIELVRRFPVDLGFVKAHLFKMLFHSYELHAPLQDWLSNFSIRGSGSSTLQEDAEKLDEVASVASTCALGQLRDHLLQLRSSELLCGVDGLQPKRLNERRLKEQNGGTPPDVFADDVTFGIDFS